MSEHNVNEDFFYSLFSNIYYYEQVPSYSNNEVSTTESVQCLLKSFYQRKLDRKFMDRKVVILGFGRMVHLALQAELKNHGYACEVEKSVDLPHCTLFTHTDAVHDNHILEIKTISTIPHEILDHHLLQANTYAIIHQKPLGYVAYVHKKIGSFHVFPFKPNMDSYELICLRATRLSYSLNTNRRPVPEPTWLCRYCEYVDVCPKPQKRFPRTGGL